MSAKELGRVRAAAKSFWGSLDSAARGDLGDAMVLGDLDWREWLNSKPAPGFWREVDALRIDWEIASGVSS